MTTPWKVIGEDGKIRAARTVEAQEATLFDLGGETVTAQWTNRDGLPCAIRAFKRYVHPDVIASGKCAVVVLDGHGVHIRPSGWQP